MWWDPGTIPQNTKPIRYILGAYGSLRTEGMDLIRLEGLNWDASDDVYYRLPAPWYRNARSSGIKLGYSIEKTDKKTNSNGHQNTASKVQGLGLPEVSGGGDEWTGPYYPYDRGEDVNGYSYGQYIYGAPDGHPDGVIIAFTPGGDGLPY